MTDPGTELTVRAAWEGAQRRTALGEACARAEREAAEAERAEVERAADEQDARESAAWKRMLTGEPGLSLGAVLQRSRDAQDGPGRNPAAPWGSEANPATWVGDVLLEPVSQVQRSADVLAQAQRLREDPFMATMVKRYGQRRGGRGEVSRNTPTGEVYCLDCIEQGFTAEESVVVHAMPGSPAPRTVPSYAPERSTRSYAPSGLGWPEIVR